jgi:hypothetical protein
MPPRHVRDDCPVLEAFQHDLRLQVGQFRRRPPSVITWT